MLHGAVTVSIYKILSHSAEAMMLLINVDVYVYIYICLCVLFYAVVLCVVMYVHHFNVL